MKKNFIRIVLLAGGIIVLILGIILLTPARADASLGNTGIPARCYNIGFSSSITLTCLTPSGSATSFVSGQRVPTGYYFLVTDIMITPNSGTTSSDALVDFDLKDAYGAGSLQSSNHFRNFEGGTFGQHFNAPMWVLLPDHYLLAVTRAGNLQTFEIRVNGLLVTNINYIPLVNAP
jgi:hypothetical protein